MRTIVSFKRMIKILPWVQKQKYLCQIVVMILVGAGKQSFLAKVEEKIFQLESIVVSCKPAKRKLELAGTKQQVMRWD